MSSPEELLRIRNIPDYSVFASENTTPVISESLFGDDQKIVSKKSIGAGGSFRTKCYELELLDGVLMPLYIKLCSKTGSLMEGLGWYLNNVLTNQNLTFVVKEEDEYLSNSGSILMQKVPGTHMSFDLKERRSSYNVGVASELGELLNLADRHYANCLRDNKGVVRHIDFEYLFNTEWHFSTKVMVKEYTSFGKFDLWLGKRAARKDIRQRFVENIDDIKSVIDWVDERVSFASIKGVIPDPFGHMCKYLGVDK